MFQKIIFEIILLVVVVFASSIPSKKDQLEWSSRTRKRWKPQMKGKKDLASSCGLVVKADWVQTPTMETIFQAPFIWIKA
jgi:hypothetical protein